jgi:hypothetical protein
MMLFRSREEAHEWSRNAGRPHGALVALGQLERLARAWYRDRLRPDWRPRTVAQSQKILADAGLTGPFWSLT